MWVLFIGGKGLKNVLLNTLDFVKTAQSIKPT